MTRAERTAWLYEEIARMAADKAIHDAQANELIAEALGGTEWLLSTNDGEVE